MRRKPPIVSEFMSRLPVELDKDETLEDAEMMSRKLGSAVIVDAEIVVGIFTVTDALRALIAAYGK